MFGKRLFTLLLMLLLQPGANAEVAYTDASGRVWHQLTDTLGLSWLDMTGVCAESSGNCNGSLGGRDLTGLRWADVATVNELFRELSGGAGFPDALPQEFEIIDSTWGPLAIDEDGAGPDTGYFHKTYSSGSGEHTAYGWTRTRRTPGEFAIYLGRITESATFDKLQTDDVADDVSGSALTGFWLYEPVVVPLPPALWLFASAVAGSLLRKRREFTVS